MLCIGGSPPRTYKSYKGEKFEKYKQKMLRLLNGVSDTSLRDEDKKKLIEDLKEIVKSYSL